MVDIPSSSAYPLPTFASVDHRGNGHVAPGALFLEYCKAREVLQTRDAEHGPALAHDIRAFEQFVVPAVDAELPTVLHPSLVDRNWHSLHEPVKLAEVLLDLVWLNLNFVSGLVQCWAARRLVSRILNLCHIIDVWTFVDVPRKDGIPTPQEMKQLALKTLNAVLHDLGRNTRVDDTGSSPWRTLNDMMIEAVDTCHDTLNSASIFTIPTSVCLISSAPVFMIPGTQSDVGKSLALDIGDPCDIPLLISICLHAVSKMLSGTLSSSAAMPKLAQKTMDFTRTAYHAFTSPALSRQPNKRVMSMASCCGVAARISQGFPGLAVAAESLAMDIFSRRVKEADVWSCCDDEIQNIVRDLATIHNIIHPLLAAIRDETVPRNESLQGLFFTYVQNRLKDMPLSIRKLCLEVVDLWELSETSNLIKVLLEHQIRKDVEVETATAWRTRFRSTASDVAGGLDWMDDEDSQESAVFILNTLDTLTQHLGNHIPPMKHDGRLDLCRKLKALSSLVVEAPEVQSGGDGEAGGMPVLRSLLPTLAVIAEGMSDNPGIPVLLHVQQLIATLLPYDDLQLEAGTWSCFKICLDSGMKSPNRSVRLASGRTLAQIFRTARSRQLLMPPDMVGLLDILQHLVEGPSPQIRETTLITLGIVGKHAEGADLGRVIMILYHQLAVGNVLLRGTAFAQIVAIAQSRDTIPLHITSPYMTELAPFVVSRIVTHPSLLKEVSRLMHQGSRAFVENSLYLTLPTLYIEQNVDVLRRIAEWLDRDLWDLTIPYIHEVLARIYLIPNDQDMQNSVKFMMSMLPEGTDSRLDISDIVNAFLEGLIKTMVIAAGEEDSRRRQEVIQALERIANSLDKRLRRSNTNTVVGAVLAARTRGVVNQLVIVLQGPISRYPIKFKLSVLRGFSWMITEIGVEITNVAPQIVACMQSLLVTPELRTETLTTWDTLITTLRPADVGPYVGVVTATLITQWSSFPPEARNQAKKTLQYIVCQIGEQLHDYLDEAADPRNNKALDDITRKLAQARKGWSWSHELRSLLKKTSSPNQTVVQQALAEMKAVTTKALANGTSPLQNMLAGDMFDPLIGEIMAALHRVSSREASDIEPVRELAYECMAILGAVDPDRYEMKNDLKRVVVHNFQDEDEARSFAVHLITHLLVDLYHSTNDVQYQGYIMFAIQELSRFCQFTPQVAEGKTAPVKARKRWLALPKHVIEVVAPLLDAGYMAPPQLPQEQLEMPIYPTQTSYREWLQIWAGYLITKVSGDYAPEIFGVFSRVVRQGDAGIAYDLLPNLVLNVLVSSDEEAFKIRAELLVVLEDQVNAASSSSVEKKFLSASAVFVLLEHLSSWVRSIRQLTGQSDSRKQRELRAQLLRVESVLSSVNRGLMARAALKCKSYTLSLVNFEQQIQDMRERKGVQDTDFEEYYESLHEIYAALDEPDGMEGISVLISAPSLEHQIRQHESTGRWTSAQSCWEVCLQREPDNLNHHVGLLRCLRNLGHYDTLRTHVKGVLIRNPEWESSLAGFHVESSWIVGDWADVRRIVDTTNAESSPIIFARLLLMMQEPDPVPLGKAFVEARMHLGGPISKSGVAGHRQSYDSLVDLQLLRELELIHAVETKKNRKHDDLPRLSHNLANRLDLTLPTFRNRERILSFRRTAYKLSEAQLFSEEITTSWLSTARMARKAGHWQTAYSATLQGRQSQNLLAHLESAKLTKAMGEPQRALQELEANLRRHGVVGNDVIDVTMDESDGDRRMRAKALLLRARWMQESERFDPDNVGKIFGAASKAYDWEKGFFRLGQYQDHFKDSIEDLSRRCRMMVQVVKVYLRAINTGQKYIYHTVPRVLTLWLDFGERYEEYPKGSKLLDALNTEMNGFAHKTPSLKWYIAFPQIVSRLTHSAKAVHAILQRIIGVVLQEQTHQAMWLFASTVKSTNAERKARSRQILDKLRNAPQNADKDVPRIINDCVAMVGALLHLCDHPIQGAAARSFRLSMKSDFPDLNGMLPSRLIIPLQESLTAQIQPNVPIHSDYQAFPIDAPTFQGWNDEIEVMKSLAKPRKVTIHGSNGQTYIFLGKPKDDLRKDARLMDFNGLINKLLTTNSDSRRRRLHIRTYGVITLNEECGFVQWVPNTMPIRPILVNLYAASGVEPWNKAMNEVFDKIKQEPHNAAILFKEKILPIFPPVFHKWFLDSFPEPSSWLAARLTYARTAAVMSMVGYILGLGDRHLENILLDVNNADVVHVDFNCLFEKGTQLEIPERVPFRLTQNIIDGFGVTGVEGVFRIACEITMQLLRDNKDTLMSVLDAFVHDPLVEWTDEQKKNVNLEKRQRSIANVKQPPETVKNMVLPETDLRKLALNALAPIARKLKGLRTKGSTKELNVNSLVEVLIQEAIDPQNLGRMYPGWAPWN